MVEIRQTIRYSNRKKVGKQSQTHFAASDYGLPLYNITVNTWFSILMIKISKLEKPGLGGNGQNPPKTPKIAIFLSKKGVGK